MAHRSHAFTHDAAQPEAPAALGAALRQRVSARIVRQAAEKPVWRAATRPCAAGRTVEGGVPSTACPCARAQAHALEERCAAAPAGEIHGRRLSSNEGGGSAASRVEGQAQQLLCMPRVYFALSKTAGSVVTSFSTLYSFLCLFAMLTCNYTRIRSRPARPRPALCFPRAHRKG